MIIVNKVLEMQTISNSLRRNGDIIVFVPTMGYLHQGHLSLVELAKDYGNKTVVSIFVNPTQFGPNEDYHRYPRNFKRDRQLLEDLNVDFLFAPDIDEMYPDDYHTYVKITKYTNKFEGIHRPGHFDGVATIITKLFNVVQPHVTILGQKDFQQTFLIKQLVKDLLYDIKIVVGPTVREENGLAMSSRNTYLTPEDRDKASIIFKSIQKAIDIIQSGEKKRKIINATLIQSLRTLREIKIDYACAVDATSLDEPEEFHSGQQIAILVAAYLGKTRLIDNGITTAP
ncbi:MAG: pantoate--beta-alanine ligase [Candidatus Kapaibacteriales bacterium]